MMNHLDRLAEQKITKNRKNPATIPDDLRFRDSQIGAKNWLMAIWWAVGDLNL